MMRAASLTCGGMIAVDAAPVAFEDVYVRHSDQVYRFCVALLRDPSDAEDVAATAFLAAYRAYPRVQPPAAEVRAWLFRIARNACIDHLRRRARSWRLLGALRGARGTQAEVEGVVQLRGDLREVVTVLATLPRRERELVGLRVAGGLPFAEIGAIVGMSEAAARTATRRALARLTARLERTS